MDVFWKISVLKPQQIYDEKNSLDTMGLFLQKQPRNLTMAKHTLGIHQMRIMVRVIQQLQPCMSFEIDHTQEVKDIWVKVRVADLVVGSNVRPLRKALDELMRKVVRIMHYIPEKATYLEIGLPLIKEYKYEHGSGVIDLQIGGNLMPQLIDLARGYTRYSLQVAFCTSSPNVLKMYQYIAHFRDLPQIQCNVDTLRKWLQIEEKYKQPNNIRQRILNPAMKELKEKADVWFDIAERAKDGRRMIGWKFNIYTKKGKVRSLLDRQQITPQPENIVNTRMEKLLIEKYKLSSKQAKKVVEWMGMNAERHQQVGKTLHDIQLMIINHKLQSVGGYTVKVL